MPSFRLLQAEEQVLSFIVRMGKPHQRKALLDVDCVCSPVTRRLHALSCIHVSYFQPKTPRLYGGVFYHWLDRFFIPPPCPVWRMAKGETRFPCKRECHPARSITSITFLDGFFATHCQSCAFPAFIPQTCYGDILIHFAHEMLSASILQAAAWTSGPAKS